MTRVALITTTINVPTVLLTHVKNVPPNCTLDVVVAGDVSTPQATSNLVAELGGTYLDVSGGLVERWRTHEQVGLRSIQRRNLALLHALTLGPDVVVTIDDDNQPTEPRTYLQDFLAGFTAPVTHTLATSTGWYNPGKLLMPNVVHRGFPINQRHVRTTEVARELPPERYADVVAGCCVGDPDVDAIERIVTRPWVTDVVSNDPTGAIQGDVTLEPGTWAPFNTQNTAYTWAVAPLMQCLVGVGRYDDIWMSYVARCVMDRRGYLVRYGRPIAKQVRNEHNLLTDMRKEYHGYLNTDFVTEALRSVRASRVTEADSVIDALEAVYRDVRHVFTTATRNANDAWIADVREAVAEGTEVRRRSTSDD